MRAREILDEDYNQNLESDVDNLLIGAKGSGQTEVDTKLVVSQLQNMGYAVDKNSILSLLADNPTVLNATPDMIRLTHAEGDDTGYSDDDTIDDTADDTGEELGNEDPQDPNEPQAPPQPQTPTQSRMQSRRPTTPQQPQPGNTI